MEQDIANFQWFLGFLIVFAAAIVVAGVTKLVDEILFRLERRRYRRARN